MTRLPFSRAAESFRSRLRAAVPRPKRIATKCLPGPQRALTLAAMALPGMALAVQTEEGQIQYSGYHEGGRDEWRGPAGTVAVPDPIDVETLHGSAAAWLTDRLRLAFDYVQDTWSGATPILTAPEAFLTVSGASAYPVMASFADDELVPYGVDPATGMRVAQPDVVHMLSSASAETRRQADFGLSHEWDEAALELGLGFSDERDFSSQYASLNTRRDFDQKLTTLDLGFSFTDSDVDATLGPVVDWSDYGYYRNADSGSRIVVVEKDGQEIQVFTGERRDWAASAALTRVLGRNSTVSTGVTYSRSRGFLENAYKLVMFAFANPDVSLGELDLTQVFNVPENRPDERNQWTWNTELSQYFAGPDGALHLGYRLADDDWGITSHTFEVNWSQAIGDSWLITPRIRYYSQEAAEFYQPYFILGQAAPVEPDGSLDFGAFPVDHYSSDHRLSAFGALSGGLTIRKQFANGVSLEAGGEYYTHEGGLKLGGGGEGDYADFDYYVLNIGLKVDLGAEAADSSSGAAPAAETGEDHQDHAEHEQHAGHDLPAGLMYGHMLEKSNDFMLGYRFMHSAQSGDMRHGSHDVSDAEIIANGCGDVACTFTPQEMTMNMHMVDVMYAPADWLTLMSMFQFMDMDMTTRLLEGAVIGSGGEPGHHGGAHYHHATGSIGDTIVAAMVRLIDRPSTDIHVGLGVSVPTGDVDIRMTDGNFIHYGMQTGSGTWDYQPSVTYAGHLEDWSWGAQVSGILRGEGPNDSGYRLGNVVQSTAWAGYRVANWLSASVRGIYTRQGYIYGQFEPLPPITGPMDHPDGYGGRYVDVGLGLSAAVPGRSLQGDRIIAEWLQPVSEDLNGYQLERDGSLTVSWTFSF
jgi:hypothetical protein